MEQAEPVAHPAIAGETPVPGRSGPRRASAVVATLHDDVNGAVSFARDAELALPFERSECEAGACVYAYVGTDPLEDALDVELADRDDVEQLVAILMLGDTETPNRGTFRVAIEIAADAALGGSTLGFTLTSEGSTIRLGG